MLYRMKFDGSIGAIFKHCGIDTSEAMEYWPIGRTKIGIDIGKALGYSAQHAAICAFIENAFDNFKSGRINRERLEFFHTRLLNWVETCHRKYVSHTRVMLENSVKEVNELETERNPQSAGDVSDELHPSNTNSLQKSAVAISDEEELIREREISEQLLDKWEKLGRISALKTIKVNVIDPMGNYSKEWVIGKDIREDVVEKAKHPETNELYAFTVYEKGKPKTNVVTYDFWLQIKATMGE